MLDQDSRCDASLIPCHPAAEQAKRCGDFEGRFSDRQFIVFLPWSALSILLEWGCRPLKLPRGGALPLLDVIAKQSESF